MLPYIQIGSVLDLERGTRQVRVLVVKFCEKLDNEPYYPVAVIGLKKKPLDWLSDKLRANRLLNLISSKPIRTKYFQMKLADEIPL